MWWKRLGSDLQALTIVVVLSAFLHLAYAWNIAPRWLNQDEAAILMNARFLAEAGKDEWGASLPFVFRSFGDAKLPGFIWVTTLSGTLLNFAPLAVRLPSFLAGLLLPVALYIFVKRVFDSSSVALAAAFFAVISPWTYHYASVGFESHVALVVFLFALAFWFAPAPSWKSDLLASVLSLYAGLTYNSPFLLLPFVAAALMVWRWKDRSAGVRGVVLLGSVFAAILGLTWGATSQKQGITFFQDGTVLSAYPEYRASFSGSMQKILGNKWVYFLRIGVENFVSSFGWEFLVSRGGANPWHTIPGVGHLAFLSLPAAALGFGLSFQKAWNTRSLRRLIPVFLLLASLAPATITTDAPHATRSLFFFVMLLSFAGLGLFASYEWMCRTWKGSVGKVGLSVVSMLLIASFAVWWIPAYKNWKKHIDPHWYAGLEEALSQTEVRTAERVFIVDPEGVLYTRVSVWSSVPYEHFAQTVRRSPPATTGLVRVEKLGKYEFIFQKSDAQGPGVVLEQQGNRSWGTIVL